MLTELGALGGSLSVYAYGLEHELFDVGRRIVFIIEVLSDPECMKEDGPNRVVP